MLGSIYGTKVIYGQRVIYLNLPYAERAYGAGVASIAGDALTLSCAIKALSVDEATVKSLTQSGVSESLGAQSINTFAFIGHLEPNGIANTIGHVAVTSDTTSLARAVAADSSCYSAHSFSEVAETTAALVNVISVSGDEAWYTFNQIVRVMLILSEILKTFYALLPEQITEVALLPEHKAEISPWLAYATTLSLYSDKITASDLTQEYIATAAVQPEYLTQHDPYIHYTTESEVY